MDENAELKRKVFKKGFIHLIIPWGEAMSEFIWCWTKGSTKVYTRNVKIAEQAMKKGLLVMGIKAPSRVMKGRMV